MEELIAKYDADGRKKYDELRRLFPTIKDFMLANSPDRQMEYQQSR